MLMSEKHGIDETDRIELTSLSSKKTKLKFLVFAQFHVLFVMSLKSASYKNIYLQHGIKLTFLKMNTKWRKPVNPTMQKMMTIQNVVLNTSENVDQDKASSGLLMKSLYSSE